MSVSANFLNAGSTHRERLTFSAISWKIALDLGFRQSSRARLKHFFGSLGLTSPGRKYPFPLSPLKPLAD